MSIDSAIDLGVLRTHDEARALLRAECDRLGARWTLDVLDPDRKGAKYARYTVRLPRIGERDLSEASTYSLPVPAKSIAGHVRTMIEGAANAVRNDRVK